MNYTIRKLFYGIAVVTLFSGCSTNQNLLEQDFGKAYRNMVAEQIYDPNAAMNPPVEPPERLDGDRASNVIETYRKGETSETNMAPAVSIKLGK